MEVCIRAGDPVENFGRGDNSSHMTSLMSLNLCENRSGLEHRGSSTRPSGAQADWLFLKVKKLADVARKAEDFHKEAAELYIGKKVGWKNHRKKRGKISA